VFKNLTYKQKNRILAIASVCFLAVIYLSAIKKTVVLYDECSDLEKQLELVTEAPRRIVSLEKQLSNIESKLGSRINLGIDNQQQLLELLTNYCEEHNVRLQEFPKPVVTGKDEYAIETNIFIVEGDFIKLLKLIYTLEQEYKIGKIASVHFDSKKNYKTKRVELMATIYLQNIKKLTS